MTSDPIDPIATAIQTAVDTIQRRSQAETQRNLAWYHAVGLAIATVPSGYNAKRMTNLADELKRRGVMGLDKSMLHKCERFAKRIEVADVRKLDGKRVSWRAAARLPNEQLSNTQVADLIQRVDTGSLPAKDLNAEIQATLGGRSALTPRSLAAAETNAKLNVELLIRFARQASTDHQKDKAKAALRSLKTQLERVPSALLS